MTAHTASTSFAPVHGTSAHDRTQTARRICAVQLYDRRTGSAHRVNGTPLVIYTRDPSAAVEDLLEGRNPENWEARISEIEVGRAR